MKRGTLVLLGLGLGLILLQGCNRKVAPISGTAGLAEDRVAGESPSNTLSDTLKEEQVRAGAMDGTADGEGNVEERIAAAESGSGELNDIYFEFDQAALREEAKSILQKNAKLLISDPSAKIQIQGHTDERGSEEYNLALGARRAQIVKRFLTAMGIEANRLQTISFGEEKPFCTQSEENCWKQNRRAHFTAQSPR